MTSQPFAKRMILKVASFSLLGILVPTVLFLDICHGAVIRPMPFSKSVKDLPGHLAAWYFLTLTASAIVSSAFGGRRCGWHGARMSWGMQVLLDGILLVFACVGIGSQTVSMQTVCSQMQRYCESEIRNTYLALGGTLLALARFLTAAKGALMYRGRDLFGWIPSNTRAPVSFLGSLRAITFCDRREAFRRRIDSILITSGARIYLNGNYDIVDPDVTTIGQRWSIDFLTSSAREHRALRTVRIVERIIKAEQRAEKRGGGMKHSIRRKTRKSFERWVGKKLEASDLPRRDVCIESELEALKAVESSKSVIKCPRWLTISWIPEVTRSPGGRLALELEIFAQMVLATQETGDELFYTEVMDTIPTKAWSVRVESRGVIRIVLAAFREVSSTLVSQEDRDTLEHSKDEFILLFRQVMAASILLAAENKSMCVSQLDLIEALKHALKCGQRLWRAELHCYFSKKTIPNAKACVDRVLEDSIEEKLVSTFLNNLRSLRGETGSANESGHPFRAWVP